MRAVTAKGARRESASASIRGAMLSGPSSWICLSTTRRFWLAGSEAISSRACSAAGDSEACSVAWESPASDGAGFGTSPAP